MADHTDRPEQVDDPALIAAARHALHDEELIAGFAVDGEAADDPGKAKSLVERCPTCRDLYADMVAIGSSIREAGSAEAVGTARPAPRDFRLTPMDAARLHPGNAFQRAAARLRAGASMFGRPVGAGLATFGLVGLLVGTIGMGQLAFSAAPQSEGAGTAATQASSAPGPAATLDTMGVQPVASQPTDRANAGPVPTSERQKGETTALPTDSGVGSGAVQVLFAASIAVLVVGLGLLLVGERHARAWRRARERA